MDSSLWQQTPLEWANLYALFAPRVNVKGRMAFVLLVAVVWAFSWLLWRAYSVIQTPNEVLVDKLGLDIPPPPSVTLEEISSREIQLSWKASDTSGSIQEHQVEVNGKIVGTTKKNETAAAIHNLRPGTLYDVRVFNISPGRFQTPSQALHIRTSLPAYDSSTESNNESPAIRALIPRLPPTPSISTAPAITREGSGGPTGRRSTGVRRASPVGTEASTADGVSKVAEDEMDESLVELSQQFQKSQQEIEAVEAQLQEEDRDYEALLKEKEAERDDLKQKLKERDELSSDLRKQVHKAETANRAAQTEKAKKERTLDQKLSARRKRKDDMSRWEEQMAIMSDEIDSIKTRQTIAERKKQSDISELHQKIKEEDRLVKALEAENKEKALEIKALEEERKQLNFEEETDESREVDRQEHDKERRWREIMTGLQAQYARVAYELQMAHQQYGLVRERLENTRRVAAYSYTPIMQPEVENFRRGLVGVRQNRHASSQGSNVSSPRVTFGSAEPYSMNSHFNATMNASPTNMGPAFFNTANGMTLMVPLDSREETVDEPEPLTGAPMSPRADALLPADLLGDESSDDFVEQETREYSSRSTSVPQGEKEAKAEAGSPSPGTSSSPRSFQSPQENGRSKVEWDQTTSDSPGPMEKDHDEESPSKDTTNPKRQSTMANLFSFNRQRGKSMANQPPLLGSLKAGQSQSFPRNFDEFDPIDQPRRRLSYGNNWAFPGSNLLSRGQSVREPERISATRRAFPSLFGKASTATQSYDPFAPDAAMRGEGSPSRPSSVYSFDRLPRVSAEGQFHAWALDKGMRNSPLAPDWSTRSRNQSRRASIYDSTSNLSLAPAPEEEYMPPRRELSRPLQAPIGTRPASSQRPSTPKLNPAAPSFTMLFGMNRDKAKDKAKVKEEERKKANEAENASPPESRKSRDTHSIAATASTYESRDSLERTTSSYSGGGGVTPQNESTPAKPTLLSKMARKASSNKFGSWKGQGGIFSRKESSTPIGTPTGPGTETEDEIHNSSHENLHLGKSYESASNTPGDEKDKKASRSSLGSWNFMRKSKKVDKDKREDLAASEVSESMSSEQASRASQDIMTEEDDASVEIPLH